MKYILILFSFIPFITMHAQALISGYVRDAATDEPIAYVSVLEESTLHGTSTDENGFFSLIIDGYDADKSFLFSIVGYQDTSLLLFELMKSDVVYLLIDEQEVDEVVVQPINVYELLEEVKANLKQNYEDIAVCHEAFYRQVLYTNNQLDLLEEGHFSILQPSSIAQAISIKKSRAYVDMEDYKDLGKIVANNIKNDSAYIIESAEIINSFLPNIDELLNNKEGIFGPDPSRYYVFTYGGMSIKNNHILHIVNFKQKESIKKSLYDGTIYIDKETKAVKELEARMSPQGIEYQKVLSLKYRLLAKLAGYKIYVSDLAYHVSFEVYEDKWVLESGEFLIKGSVSKRKGETLNGHLNYSFEVLNTKSKAEFYNIRSNYEVIPSQKEEFNDLYFWDNGDIPLLPLSIQEDLKELD